ncbi:MAG: PilZ domain-containing protein [bacterium]|nr:PilZ domain-containing protein [bacterium]
MANASTKSAESRRDERYHVSLADEAYVEFRFPENGPRRRCKLSDLSVSGMSFTFDRDLPEMEIGTRLSSVTVGVGSCTMSGDMLVLHFAQRVDRLPVCGVLFYPATENDQRQLMTLLTGLEAARPR